MGGQPWHRAIASLVTLGMLAGVMWMEVPDWQRQATIRACRVKAHRLLSRVARASGRRAMGDELAGHRAEAEAGYGITYRLSRLRDRV